MQVVLVMFRADGDRRSFSVTRDVTVIGRREDCDLRIPLGEISRKHCRLIKDGDTLQIEDLGSSNGTFKNGVRIQSDVLDPGDTLQVGAVTFVVQIDGVPADDELRPIIAATSAAAVASSSAPTVAESHPLNPTIPSEVGDAEHFDPMIILEDPEASGGVDAIGDSQAGDDVVVDFSQQPQQQ